MKYHGSSSDGGLSNMVIGDRSLFEMFNFLIDNVCQPCIFLYPSTTRHESAFHNLIIFLQYAK